MKVLLVVLLCIYTVLGGAPTIKSDCDPTSAATDIDISVIDDDGNTETFTSTTKLTVKFSLSKTFVRTSRAELTLDIQRKFWLVGFVSVKNWMYSLAMRFIDLPPGVTHHKDNIFFVTCQAVDKYTTCPPAVGDTTLVVDFKPIFAQQAKLRNTLLGRWLGGDYKIHANAVKQRGSDAGDSDEFNLTCLDVTATAKF